jgi:hypothetical protein
MQAMMIARLNCSLARNAIATGRSSCNRSQQITPCNFRLFFILGLSYATQLIKSSMNYFYSGYIYRPTIAALLWGPKKNNLVLQMFFVSVRMELLFPRPYLRLHYFHENLILKRGNIVVISTLLSWSHSCNEHVIVMSTLLSWAHYCPEHIIVLTTLLYCPEQTFATSRSLSHELQRFFL